MFAVVDENFKKTMQNWYQHNIFPVFEQANSKIISLGKEEKLIIEFGYWWAGYIKNSVILFELMLINKYSNQSAFTMRMVMEMAADVLFMSLNQSNIDEFRKYYINGLAEIKSCSYQDFARASRKLILRDERTHEPIKTRERIKMVFGKDGLKYYDYLCCHTHLNYLGMIQDIDMSIEHDGEMDYRLEFVKYYPETFIAMIRAVENFTGENNLFDKIDTKKLKTAISDLISKHSFGVVE